jgi:hypothetical protein
MGVHIGVGQAVPGMAFQPKPGGQGGGRGSLASSPGRWFA